MATVHIYRLEDMVEISGRTMKSQPRDSTDPASWFRCSIRTFKGSPHLSLISTGYTAMAMSDTDIRYRCGDYAVVIDRKRPMLTA